MLCDLYGSEDVKIRQITITYGKGKDLLVISEQRICIETLL
ncbi:hypothetical protein [Nostoc sp.]